MLLLSQENKISKRGWMYKMEHNRRRNNPIEMTLSEQILKAKSEMCREYCKYTDVKRRGEISQETLDDICEYDCPLNKL